IPHLGLYALREDTVIIKSQVVSLIVFIGAIIISIMLEELYMVMVGMILSFSVLLLWKSIMLFSKRKILCAE
ncbi:TPA: polysaccharide biosynthesis protein, partial [Salmonella enterica]